MPTDNFPLPDAPPSGPVPEIENLYDRSGYWKAKLYSDRYPALCIGSLLMPWIIGVWIENETTACIITCFTTIMLYIDFLRLPDRDSRSLLRFLFEVVVISYLGARHAHGLLGIGLPLMYMMLFMGAISGNSINYITAVDRRGLDHLIRQAFMYSHYYPIYIPSIAQHVVLMGIVLLLCKFSTVASFVMVMTMYAIQARVTYIMSRKQQSQPLDNHSIALMEKHASADNLTEWASECDVRELDVTQDGQFKWCCCNSHSRPCFVHKYVSCFGINVPPCCRQHMNSVCVDVCDAIRECGMEGFADGGTCLGLVRHGELLRWDDDVDIGLYLPDGYPDSDLSEPPNWQKDLERSITDRGYTFLVSEGGSMHVITPCSRTKALFRQEMLAYRHDRTLIGRLTYKFYNVLEGVYQFVVKILHPLRPWTRHELLRLGVERAFQCDLIPWKKYSIPSDHPVGVLNSVLLATDMEHSRTVLIRENLSPGSITGYLAVPLESMLPVSQIPLGDTNLTVPAPHDVTVFCETAYGKGWKEVRYTFMSIEDAATRRSEVDPKYLRFIV